MYTRANRHSKPDRAVDGGTAVVQKPPVLLHRDRTIAGVLCRLLAQQGGFPAFAEQLCGAEVGVPFVREPPRV
jgi:hypothetical protein